MVIDHLFDVLRQEILGKLEQGAHSLYLRGVHGFLSFLDVLSLRFGGKALELVSFADDLLHLEDVDKRAWHAHLHLTVQLLLCETIGTFRFV